MEGRANRTLPVASSAELLAQLAGAGVSVLGLERVPRITRAQSMDILSSQATIGGYKAVLIGAAEMGKILPMLTTAAGNIPPAKAFVLGAAKLPIKTKIVTRMGEGA